MFKVTQIFFLLLALFVFSQPLQAQTGGSYGLTWSTVDTGGGGASGGGFELKGTIGQHDVGQLSGGGFSLLGGFWQSTSSVPTAISLGAARSALPQDGVPYMLFSLFSFVLSLLTLRLLSRRHSAD